MRYIDVPQVSDAETASTFYIGELRHVMRDLAEVSGHMPDDAEFRKSLAVYNEMRNVVRELYATRRDRPWDVPTEELYLLLRAGEVVPVEEFIVQARRYLAAVDSDRRRPRDNSRVVVAGAFCEQPPLGLIKSIERAGCYIVDDDFVLGTRFLTSDVALTGDPVRALAEAFVQTELRTSVMYEGDSLRKRRVMKERAEAAGAEGRDLRRAELLRSGAARPADAARRRRDGGHSVHRVQVRREHRPVPAVPRAGRHVRRLDQALGAASHEHDDAEDEFRRTADASCRRR